MQKTGSDKLTGPFQRYHNPKASLSPGYLFTQEPVEKGGHKKNAGKNEEIEKEFVKRNVNQ